MKQITLNIPNDYADVLTVTCIGNSNGKVINVTSCGFDLTGIDKKGEFIIKIEEADKKVGE